MNRAEIDHLPTIMDVPTAARALGIGRGLAYRLVQTGEIPSLRLGRLIRVRRSELLHILGIEVPQ